MITKESNITTCNLIKTNQSFIQIPFDILSRNWNTQSIVWSSTYHLEQYTKYSLSYNSAWRYNCHLYIKLHSSKFEFHLDVSFQVQNPQCQQVITDLWRSTSLWAGIGWDSVGVHWGFNSSIKKATIDSWVGWENSPLVYSFHLRHWEKLHYLTQNNSIKT
jgi:hypothetical protein